MEIAVISAILSAKSACVLPMYKYSTIRGSVGHGLKKNICLRHKTRCEDCSIVNHCPYIELFDNTVTQKEFLPFISYCSNTDQNLEKGQKIELEFVLMGNALKYTSYLLLALQEIGKSGIGANRTEFDVRVDTAIKTKTLKFNNPQPGEYNISLLSPLRAKQGSRLAKEISLEKIIMLSQKRIEMLYISNKESLPTELHSKISVQEISQNTKWLDIDRYSNRQHTKMSLGGFVGNISYSDKNGFASSLIEFASNINIGKQTTFGYGKIKQEIVK